MAARPLVAPCGCASVLIHRLTCKLVHPRGSIYTRPEIRVDEHGAWLRVGLVEIPMSEEELRRLRAEALAALDEVDG